MNRILDETASGNGRPPWWVEATYKLGIPTVAMAVLMWFLLTVVNEKLTIMQQTLSAHVTSTTLEQAQIRFYLRAICLNTSSTEAARAACAVGRDTNDAR